MKDKGVLIDSDIIIWWLRNNEKVIAQLKKLHAEYPLFTTPVTVAEIWSGARKNEENTISDIFQSIEVLTIDKETGKLAGGFVNTYGKSHSVELADSLIAATVIIHDLKIWTMNLKHYPMLKKDQFVH